MTLADVRTIDTKVDRIVVISIIVTKEVVMIMMIEIIWKMIMETAGRVDEADMGMVLFIAYDFHMSDFYNLVHFYLAYNILHMSISEQNLQRI